MAALTALGGFLGGRAEHSAGPRGEVRWEGRAVARRSREPGPLLPGGQSRLLLRAAGVLAAGVGRLL